MKPSSKWMNGQSGMTKELGTLCDLAKTPEHFTIKTCLKLQ